MTKTQWVSDEVWAQLDPSAGTLTRRQRRHAMAAVSAAVTVLIAGFVTNRSGVIQAHVDFSDLGSVAATSPNPKVFTRQFEVENNGWTTVRVTGIGQDAPGLRLLRPGDPEALVKATELVGSTPVPFDLHPGQIRAVSVSYQVADCTAVQSDSLPVTLRIDRPWGTQTISISPPLESAPGTANGLVPASAMIGWQKVLADEVCHPHGF